MGTLTFEILEIDVIGAEGVVVRGKWKLQKSDGNPSGLFTLLFKQFDGAWKIVSDHTSVADK